ncbi:MAG: hypothetical protein GY861_13790 [bacterium]|nr:hypothetical protein [bacterium]
MGLEELKTMLNNGQANIEIKNNEDYNRLRLLEDQGVDVNGQEFINGTKV